MKWLRPIVSLFFIQNIVFQLKPNIYGTRSISLNFWIFFGKQTFKKGTGGFYHLPNLPYSTITKPNLTRPFFSGWGVRPNKRDIFKVFHIHVLLINHGEGIFENHLYFRNKTWISFSVGIPRLVPQDLRWEVLKKFVITVS